MSKKVKTESQLSPKDEKEVSGQEASSERTNQEEELREQLQAKENEAEENYEKLLRAKAEFENYKKRIEREKSEIIKFSNERLIKELLPVVDNLEMALEHGKKSDNSQSLLEGIEMVLNQFLKSLEKFGVISSSVVGEQFDPAQHEAMTQVKTDEHEPNAIVSEFQKGYFLNDRLLRPAKVSVAAPTETSDESEEKTV